MELDESSFQAQAIRAFGREIARTVKYWKPAKANAVCQYCGLRFYHIIPHVWQCEREARYAAALRFVDIAEPTPRGLARAYRTRGGARLTELDEVVNAILDNELP